MAPVVSGGSTIHQGYFAAKVVDAIEASVLGDFEKVEQV